jgi:hypothetical protein
VREVAGTAESRMDEDVEGIIIFERGGRQSPDTRGRRSEEPADKRADTRSARRGSVQAPSPHISYGRVKRETPVFKLSVL